MGLGQAIGPSVQVCSFLNRTLSFDLSVSSRLGYPCPMSSKKKG
jgi:hypothetical protein